MKNMIEKMKTKFFPSKDDKIWKDWVDFKERGNEDLIQLISSELGINFKKRAIFLLFVPSSEFNTLYWKKRLGKFNYKFDFLKSLSAEELDYVVDLIIDFHSKLKPSHTGRSMVSVSGGRGITIYNQVMEKYHDALYFYNFCIIDLLDLVPKERTMELFDLFSLLDISAYSCFMDESSGYNPFRALMESDQVSERWKVLADAKMREIVEFELSGELKPRVDWENAFPQYVSIFQSMLYGEYKYSKNLYISQLKFILDKKDNKPYIDSWRLLKIFNLLSGDEFRDLRYSLIKYVLFESKNDFYIYSEETKAIANFILNEFGHDSKIAEKIHFLIKQKNQKHKESEAQRIKDERFAEEEIRKEREILSKMK